MGGMRIGHVDPYPIMDLRVLWSLGAPSISASSIPLYSFDLWWAFVQLCRTLSDESGLSMRGLDRALWQYWREYGRTLSLPE